MSMNNEGIISGGDWNENGPLTNWNTINAGNFRIEVDNNGVINGGNFYAHLHNNYNGVINNAILKTGVSVGNNGAINKLTLDGNIKLNDDIVRSAKNIEMKDGSVLNLNSSVLDFSPNYAHIVPYDFKNLTNTQIVKIDGKEFIKDGIFYNHFVIKAGDFKTHFENAEDGVINNGDFVDVYNHGVINNGNFVHLTNYNTINYCSVMLNKNKTDVFTNHGVVKNGFYIAENSYNDGTIFNGIFTGTTHNTGTIKNGKFDNIELISGAIEKCTLEKELTIKGGSLNHAILRNGASINNQAKIQINKLTIDGTKVSLDNDIIEKTNIIEINKKAILNLDFMPNFEKFTGDGKIKIGAKIYNTSGHEEKIDDDSGKYIPIDLYPIAIKKALKELNNNNVYDENNAAQDVDLMSVMPENLSIL